MRYSRTLVGICSLSLDCCDGSDEFDGQTRCTNTCAEKDREAKKSLFEELDKLKSVRIWAVESLMLAGVGEEEAVHSSWRGGTKEGCGNYRGIEIGSGA